MYESVFKRALGAFIASVACVLLLPLLFVIALWIKLDSKGPVLFRQTRLGKDGAPFTILKFRTMRLDAPHDVATNDLKRSADYITPSGRILRSTSLDELPQLLNIIKGDMAFGLQTLHPPRNGA